jgi:hypothetical protein
MARIWKALTLLVASVIAQRELFTTTRTQICSTFCLNQGDVFCSSSNHATGTCFSGNVPPQSPDLVCSNRFAHTPLVACPFEPTVCGLSHDFKVTNVTQLIQPAQQKEGTCSYLLSTEKQAILKLNTLSGNTRVQVQPDKYGLLNAHDSAIEIWEGAELILKGGVSVYILAESNGIESNFVLETMLDTDHHLGTQQIRKVSLGTPSK